MIPRFLAGALVVAAVCTARPAGAQEPLPPRPPDSIAVEGNRRVATPAVLIASGLQPGRALSYRDLQRAIQGLYATGHYEDVRLDERRLADGRTLLVIVVRERPVLLRWTVRGVDRLSERTVRERVSLAEGRPLDPSALERSRGRIDSLYRAQGYHQARVRALTVWEPDSAQVRIVFDIEEGRRVAIAMVNIEGNSEFSDEEIVAWMDTRPEGFWWFQSGEFEDDRLREDLLERLPSRYGELGYVDFQVLGDTVIVHEETGKATLGVRLSEGLPHTVGTFEVVGNRRFTTGELEAYYPFTTGGLGGFLGLGRALESGAVFDQAQWDEATQLVKTAYYNNGYIYAQVRGDVLRRTGPGGQPVVDLRWVIEEGAPAIVNRVEIRGNDVTHERVIREAIVMVPGDVFRQDALMRSYQNVSNLGFFNQPLPFPDVRPANEQGDVDVIFHVSERRTGNINFGASVGQGTGLGGFIGLEEPNLFGRAKRGRLQWQFGNNINDFDISYTDPAIRESRISGTVNLHNSRVRYRIGDLGRLQRRGGSIQVGFPFLGDRYTRVFVSYGLDQQTFTGSSTNPDFRRRFGCIECLRSTVGLSLLRDTRIDLPFPTAGAMGQVSMAQTGGLLGGDGNYQKFDLEGRWYAPLGQLGSRSPNAQPIKFVFGMGARTGFIFGDTPFFEQLFFMGGTQFGVPLRGYNEFSITPDGFDPNAQGTSASGVNAFGQTYLAMTAEVGVRFSQSLYVNTFYDAGNIWRRAGLYNPSRLFRGAGFGIALISPLGPLGLDLAYGFDRTDIYGHPDPGWKLHFRLGNFF